MRPEDDEDFDTDFVEEDFGDPRTKFEWTVIHSLMLGIVAAVLICGFGIYASAKQGRLYETRCAELNGDLAFSGAGRAHLCILKDSRVVDVSQPDYRTRK